MAAWSTWHLLRVPLELEPRRPVVDPRVIGLNPSGRINRYIRTAPDQNVEDEATLIHGSPQTVER